MTRRFYSSNNINRNKSNKLTIIIWKRENIRNPCIFFFFSKFISLNNTTPWTPTKQIMSINIIANEIEKENYQEKYYS